MMGKPPRTHNKTAIAIYRASEPVRYAREYLRTGHVDLALDNLKLGIEALEDLAGGEVQTLRLAQRFLLDGMMEVGRAKLEEGLAELGTLATAKTERGKRLFEESEGRRKVKLGIEQEEAQKAIGRK